MRCLFCGSKDDRLKEGICARCGEAIAWTGYDLTQPVILPSADGTRAPFVGGSAARLGKIRLGSRLWNWAWERAMGRAGQERARTGQGRAGLREDTGNE